MNDDIVKIYEASEIEVGFMVELLKENGIESISRNPYQEALKAGWFKSSDSELFVSISDAKEAVEIIENYKKSESLE